MSDENKLKRVVVGTPPHSEHYHIGAKGVSDILIVNDGNGQMGNYDRVHIHYDNGRHLISPAHFCIELEIL